MIVIPAIDLKDGLCVRLLQGRREDTTVYSDDPVTTALKWETKGAKRLHIVDLDGAFTGNQKNLESIIAIRKNIKIEIQVGGGIRDLERIEQLFSAGIDRVILGTVAVKQPEIVRAACAKYRGRVLVGIDASEGLVAVKGWVEVTAVRALELALRMQDCGCSGIIYTDISRDGMLAGPNISATKEMAESLNIPVIASGGIASLDDIRNLTSIRKLYGAITGKALYTGSIDLSEAIKVAGASC
jgi:phosphoribosylformimino-5-aminoimidazole carboxamide ribotide isomerase